MTVIDDIGCWVRDPEPAAGPGFRPALFVDRDGVLVEERNFLCRPQDVELIGSAAQTVAAFNAAGVPVVAVTNQSGVARGYLSWTEFESVQSEVERRLEEAAGARLDGVFACAYHEKGVGELRVRDHPWRKPNPGMLLAAASDLRLRLEESWIVGDRARDLEAGRTAGLMGGIHVPSGHGDPNERLAARLLARGGFVVETADHIGAATQLLGAFKRELAC